jgi:hypothetical protein
MSLATLYRNFDCGVAVVKSIAEHYGRAIPSDRAIEWDEGNTGGGCTLQGLVNGFAACGLASHIVNATPAPATIMNPAWGGVIPASQSQAYINAAVVGFPGGWTVVVDPPTPAPPSPLPVPPTPAPPPPPPPPQEDDMNWIFFHDVMYQGHSVSAAFMSDGRRYWWLLSEAVLADVRYVWQTAETISGRKLLIEYNKVGTPMNDLAAFGLPDNKATADLVGQPYPV